MNSNQDTPKQDAPEQLVEIITPGSIVDVAVSSGFYARIQHLTYNLVEQHLDQVPLAHEKIHGGTVTEADGWVYDYETMLILSKEIEQLFRQKGSTQMRDISTLDL